MSTHPKTSELWLRVLGPPKVAEEGRKLLPAAAAALALVLVSVSILSDGRTASITAVLAVACAAAAAVLWNHRRENLRRQIRAIATEWQLTIDTVDFPIFTLDEDGRILRMNRAAMVLSGDSYTAGIGKRINEVGSGEPWQAAADQFARALREGRARTVVVQAEAEDETWEITVRQIQNPGGARSKLIVLARDISETVALQESLKHREVMSAMGSLVAGVAHDIRNFLHVTTATLDNFEARLGDRPEYRSYIDTLHEQGERMTTMMQDLLDYGKPVEDSQELVAADEVMAEARHLCAPRAAQAGVILNARREGEIADVPIHRDRMLRVFRNVLDNAVQHSGTGERVTATTRQIEGWVEIEVRDQGPGFRPEDLPRVFEPFFTQRDGGTGLGLAIVRRVVEEHGGEVRAENHPAGGAVIRIRLPLPPAR